MAHNRTLDLTLCLWSLTPTPPTLTSDPKPLGSRGGAWDGYFNVVLSVSEATPRRCNLLNNSTDVFMGWRQIDGQGAQYPRLQVSPSNPVIIYRCVPLCLT